MKNKRISILLILIFIISVLSGCSQNIHKEETLTGHDTIKVVDQLGREVEVLKEPQRIVSSYYVTSSLLVALGAKDKVVGLELKADTRELYKKASPEFLQLPAVGSGKTFNVEECAKLKPDLVILPYRLEEFIVPLEKLGIPVIAVAPESMKDFMECIRLVGQATGRQKQADKLIDYYEETTNKVKQMTEKITDKPFVYIAGSRSPYVTCTKEMYQNDLINLAGGYNVSSEIEKGHWQTISPEQLATWNPEYMYRVSYADYALEDMKNDTKLQEIEAVKKGNIYTFPSNLEAWDYPTPSSSLGMLYLLNSLHPELYSKEDYSKDAQAFYKDFYHIKVTDEELGL